MAEKEDMKKEQQAEETAAPKVNEDNKNDKKARKEEKKAVSKEVEALKKQCEELKKKVEDLEKEKKDDSDKLAKEKNDYIRLMAEFETFRRRSSEDRLSLVASAAADTIKGLLPVLDDCERAIKMLETSSDEAAKEGTSLIYTKLMDYLKTRGLAVIEAKGEVFNTDFHEALTQVPAPSEDMKGKVLDVIQTGYTLNGKVLRYAKVVVGA